VTLALVVGLFGAVGTVLRYLADGAVGDRVGGPFPWGTLSVNVAGSLVLGLLIGLTWYHGLAEHWRIALGTGLCGGFTTWSTASWETVRLAEEGLWHHAVSYALGGLALALGAGAAGIALASLHP
jgi:fluoride exporter